MRQVRKGCIYPIIVLVVAGITQLYELSLVCFPILVGMGCISIYRINRSREREKQYEDEYTQLTVYMEQLLCSYRRLGHAGRAMEDCCSIFDASSKMGKAVWEARHILLSGDGVEDGNLLQAAFSVVEKAFDSRRLRIVHQFVCSGERTGGECGASTDILLEDLELWKNRTRLYQGKKHFIKVECSIATILSVLLCYVSQMMTPEELGFHISDSKIYQITTVLAMISFLAILARIYKKLSGSWLDSPIIKNENQMARMQQLYEILRQPQKHHTLSYHMARKLVGRYVKSEFPYWLLLVTLYLQWESSYQALRCSMGETRGVFRQEVERLTEDIYDAPRALAPYLDFFSELKLPELQTGMKILYSVNSNGYEDSKKQLDFLIAQNNRLMDQQESYIQTSKMAGMSMLKQLPMVISCCKLLVDLINLLAMTMSNFQNISV